MGKLIDMTGWRMSEHGVPNSRLTIIGRDGMTTHGQEAKWICQCDCGTVFSARSRHIRMGHTISCGCYHKQELSERATIDMKGWIMKEHGVPDCKLTVIEKVEKPIETDRQYAYWLCKCECGNMVVCNAYDLRKGHIKTCGCGTSKGEAKILKCLNDNAITYRRQYMYDDLVSDSGARLKFDFAIFKNNHLSFLIEYSGRQHTDATSFFYTEEKVINDAKKYAYCRDHNIPLHYIDYQDDTIAALTDLLRQYQFDIKQF